MKNELQKLRNKIDQIDQKLLELLADRFKVTEKVGEYKSKHSLSPFSKEREEAVFRNKRKLAKKLKLDEDIAEEIFHIIIERVKINHQEIIDKK